MQSSLDIKNFFFLLMKRCTLTISKVWLLCQPELFPFRLGHILKIASLNMYSANVCK